METWTGGPSHLKAFTLVELIVVISVIAMLMAILAPAISRARGSALRTTCATNLHSLGLAFQMYLDDYDDIMPPACSLPMNNPTGKKPVTEFLLAYLNNEPKAFKCPGDKGPNNYFQSQGTSYEYNHRLGGRRINESLQVKMGSEKPGNIEVMFDCITFHGKPGRPGAKNYLYADWHVGDLGRQ